MTDSAATAGSELETQHVQVIALPWPPSVNTYWRHPTSGRLAGRHLISERGRSYRQQVKEICSSVIPVMGRVSVEVVANPPDRRRRDLDNILKGLLDGLTHAAVIEDDSLIDHLQIVRSTVCDQGKGSVHVRIFALG